MPEAVARLQEWIRHYGIAAENNKVSESCDFTMGSAARCGLPARRADADRRQPGIFATLDAGAKRTVGLYFMYDVKQVDPDRNGRRRRGKPPGRQCRSSARW